jgi:hypothetical protein
MAFKKTGNSRDDKSSQTSGRPTGGDRSKRPSTSSTSGRGKTGPSGFSKPDTDRPKKRYTSDESSEKKSYSRKPSGTGYGPGDKPARKFGSDAAGDRKPFGDKKPFGAGRNRSTGDRDGKPAFGDRPKRSFGSDAPGDKKPYGDKKPFAQAAEVNLLQTALTNPPLATALKETTAAMPQVIENQAPAIKNAKAIMKHPSANARKAATPSARHVSAATRKPLPALCAAVTKRLRNLLMTA